MSELEMELAQRNRIAWLLHVTVNGSAADRREALERMYGLNRLNSFNGVPNGQG